MKNALFHRKISEVCQIKPPKKEAKSKLGKNDRVSFLPMNQLGIYSKDIGLETSKPLTNVYGGYTYFADNDVLLAKITPCFENGKLGIARNLINGVGFGSSEFVVFRCSGEVDPEYLFYFLSKDDFRRSGTRVMTGAVGHKRVPKEFIENYKIPLPPLPEQKRIIAILDEAFKGTDAAIANTEKNLANARELFTNRLSVIFTSPIDAMRDGWEDLTLGEVTKIVSGGTPKSGTKEFWDGGILWITPKDMGALDDIRANETSRTISYQGLVKSSAKLVPVNSVILSTRAPIGHLVINDVEMAFNQGCRGLVPSEKLLTKFLFYFLKSNINLLNELGTGTTFKELAKGALESIVIPLPALSEQWRIVEYLDQLSAESQRLGNAYRRKIARLAELKQSILHKAFSGELTSQPDRVLKEAVA